MPRISISASKRRASGAKQMARIRPSRQFVQKMEDRDLSAHALQRRWFNFPSKGFGENDRSTDTIKCNAIRIQAILRTKQVPGNYRIHFAVAQQRQMWVEGQSDDVWPDFFDDPNVLGTAADFNREPLTTPDFNEIHGKINPRKYNVLKHEFRDLVGADLSGLQNISERQWDIDWFLPINKQFSFTIPSRDRFPDYPIRVFIWCAALQTTNQAVLNASNVYDYEESRTVYFNNCFNNY